jgi:NADH-quinone oxidoreductase subunit E
MTVGAESSHFLTNADSFARIEANEESVAKANSVTGDKERERILRETARVLKGFGKKRQHLIPILQVMQEKLGYLPREAMTAAAEHLGIAAIDVYGVVTFYNQFRLTPPGLHSVKVCLGTACHMKGGYITLEAWQRRLEIQSGETTPDKEFDLGTVACVGCCTKAPVTIVDGKPEGVVDPTRVDGILLGFGHEYKQREKEKSESK